MAVSFGGIYDPGVGRGVDAANKSVRATNVAEWPVLEEV